MNQKIEKVLTEAAHQNGVEMEEVKQGISETWKYICENPRPGVRKFGLSLMNGNNPPSPEKITLYLGMLTQLCNSAPLINEPDAEKRMDMAMEKIVDLHQSGAV